MIYLDTSVALAHLLAEDLEPPAELWDQLLVSSRLFEYELWVRVNAQGLAKTHGEAARDWVGRIALLELVPPVLARALEPFPLPVRTLDAIHLASIAFLREQGNAVELVTYDKRMLEAARKCKMAVSPLSLHAPRT